MSYLFLISNPIWNTKVPYIKNEEKPEANMHSLSNRLVRKNPKTKGVAIIADPNPNPIKNNNLEYVVALMRPSSSFITNATLISAMKYREIPIPIKLKIPFIAVVKPKYNNRSERVPKIIKSRYIPH